ncbi:MFS transporter [Rhodococcus opacus]|nr:MFS transporter [Rhodococcus opacus]
MTGYYGLTTWIGKLHDNGGSTSPRASGSSSPWLCVGSPASSRRVLIERLGRRYCLAGYTIGAGIAAFFYGQSAGTVELILAGSFLQFFFFGMFSSIFAYTPELFPTRSRGAESAPRQRWGGWVRSSAPSGPFLLSFGGTGLVFSTSAVLFAIGALIVITRCRRRRTLSLEQIH